MIGSIFYKLFPALALRGKTDLSLNLDSSKYVNEIDQLRCEIMNRLDEANQEKTNVLLGITSFEYAEGAYQTAFNLANSFSQVYGKVLLIDLDFRNAELSKAVCSPERQTNLNDALVQPASETMKQILSSAICSFEGSNLNILPAVCSALNPSKLLELLHTREVLQQLGTEYDVIVCAISPASVYADASMIARDLDGLIFCAREDYTKREQINDLFSQSPFLKKKTLGFMYYKV